MKLKLSKKTKTFLWVATALATSTAATTLLTSCSTANQTITNDIGGWDKDYGINDATYVRMEEDFKALYESQLDDKKRDGDIDDATYNLQLTTFQNKLNSLHTSLYSDENKTLSYTIRTNVLRDYARNNYGIRLSRQSNVSLSVTISGIKGSIINSVMWLCKECKITDTDTYRKNAETKFDELYKEAITKYGEDDVVSIVQYVQNGMVSCFANINKELDCIATQQQLKDFISKYQICVKDDISKDYYWDKLFSKYGKGGKEISVEDFNSIFTMTYEETDPQSSNNSYFSTSKKTIEFKDGMITGYTLKPILVEMNGNASTNTYSIDVDYTLVNNNYKDDEKVAELTAHSSQLKDKSVYEDENITIFDLNANDGEREYTNYVLPITEDYEEQQIKATYFNNENFKFTWSTSEEYGYDDFWTEPNEKGEYKSKLDVSGLATSGMMINGKLLSDILDEAGKISLSGGSTSLHGKAKTKGEDSKQWKLIIDNEDVDKDAIQWKLISPTNGELPDTISISDGVVSWTDKIEAKTYNFSVLAICKETKIQSPLITLTISSSEQSENVENFNHNLKNTLYDENTIDQKLLEFVKNVDFSLDYTENDYSTDKDGKKGEILVNDIIIGYKNSKNTFNVSDSTTKKAISDAINNDSGVTKRVSQNFWLRTKLDYDNLVSGLNVKDFKETIDSIHAIIDSTVKRFYIMLGVFSAFIIVAHIASLIMEAKSAVPYNYLRIDFLKFFMTIVIVLTVIAVIGSIIWLFFDLDKPNNRLSDALDKVDHNKKDSCYKIILNIDNDEKYFKNETGKAEFNKLSIDDMRNKKVYYESGYKTTKNDKTESDIQEFYNGKDEYNAIANNLKDMNDNYITINFYLVLWCVLLSVFMTYLVLAFSSKVYSNHLRDVDLRLNDHINRQDTWLNKDGFLQKLGYYYEIIQGRYGAIMIHTL